MGNSGLFETGIAIIGDVIKSAAEIGNIPTWWIATLTSHFFVTCGNTVF
jgi:hypothetical protein